MSAVTTDRATGAGSTTQPRLRPTPAGAVAAVYAGQLARVRVARGPLVFVAVLQSVGILLLLWPTLNALWLASDGKPDWGLVAIFCIGTALMRSAGCAINDFADRDFDKHVKRTAERPLTSGKIAAWEAVVVAAVLALISFALILPLNTLTKQLSVAAVLIAASYPYFKRFFAIPQAYLGIAFGFGIPMAFAAVQGTVPTAAWLLLAANIFWAVAYDTEYAMVDRRRSENRHQDIGHHLRALRCGGRDAVLCAGMCADPRGGLAARLAILVCRGPAGRRRLRGLSLHADPRARPHALLCRLPS